MQNKKYEQIAYDEASQSKCIERQVGAVIVIPDTGEVIGQGHNYSTTCSCNDNNPNLRCPDDVIHAEVAALNDMMKNIDGKIISYNNLEMYITQPPCNECLIAINKVFHLHKIHITPIICEQFLKFDGDKNRLDLIPPEWDYALGKVLTYGAIKYKPNNWRKGQKERYVGAVKRHFNAYLRGEIFDPLLHEDGSKGSGMSHLWHAFTNIGFLITFELASCNVGLLELHEFIVTKYNEEK